MAEFRDKFWENYQKELQDGYFKLVGNKKSLKPEFIVEYPKKIAWQLSDDKKNKMSQLWKFYDHTMRIRDSLRQSGNSLETLKAELCELQPAVNYAKERGVVTYKFKNFIDFNIECINDNEDLRAFIKHFQSVIAYLPRKNQDRRDRE